MFKLKYIALLLVWVLLISNAPFCFCLFKGFPYMALKVISMIILSVLIITNYKKIVIGNIHIYIVLLLNLVFYIFSYFYHNDDLFLSNFIPLFYIVVIYIAIINFIGVESFAKSFIIILIIMGLLGSIAFLLAITGVLTDFNYVWEGGRPIYNYILTFSTGVLNKDRFLGNFELIRVSGYFDEPGAMALYIIFALIINKLLFNNHKYERLLIFSGVFTFSLAYYFGLFIYVLFYKNWYRYYIIIVLTVGFFLIVLHFSKENSSVAQAIYKVTFERVETSDSGGIKGDNRTEHFSTGFEFFKERPLFGYGLTNVLKGYVFIGYDPSSLIGFLVFFGIIGTFIVFSVFFLQFKYIFAFGNGLMINSLVFKIVLIQIFTYIQRPLINVPLAFVTLIIIAESMDLLFNGQNLNFPKISINK